MILVVNGALSSSKIMQIEEQSATAFQPPAKQPRHALATVATQKTNLSKMHFSGSYRVRWSTDWQSKALLNQRLFKWLLRCSRYSHPTKNLWAITWSVCRISPIFSAPVQRHLPSTANQSRQQCSSTRLHKNQSIRAWKVLQMTSLPVQLLSRLEVFFPKIVLWLEATWVV